MSGRRIFAKLLALARKRRLDRELDENIRAHLELAEKDALARGLSPEAARQEARRRLGGIEQMKEEHRDRRGIRWLETLFRDFRHGLASLRRAPGFALVVIAVLALGIGGTVAMFGVVDAVLLKPLPFPEPGRMVRVWEAPRPGVVNATTVAQFFAWKRSQGVFAALAAEQPVSAALNGRGGPRRLSGMLVTPEYFKIFATSVALGRTFTPADGDPGAVPAIVLSYAAWETYFGGDPGILHRRVILDGETCHVIGVLGPGPFDRERIQFWKPLVFTPAQRASAVHWLTVYGRLRAGVSLAQARDKLQAIHAALVADQPINERGGSIAMEPLARLLVGAHLQHSIFIAFGAVFLVLLVACANVANLLFARSATRGTELAVRSALGAGRGRLILQLLAESFALCVVGGIAGLSVAWFLTRAAAPLLSQSLPFTVDVRLNPNVLAFAAAVVLGVVLVSGVFPALRASAGNLADSLKQSARSSSASPVRLRRAIVVGEIALSLVLVCGALLLVRSLVKLERLDTGVHIEHVMTASLDLPKDAYPTPRKAALFYDALTRRLRSEPGIADVGLSTYLPLQWIGNGEAIQVAGAEKLVRVRFKRVGPGYFGTLGIPVLAGRGIVPRDRQGSPRIVVINQVLKAALAQAGMRHPVGKVVRLSSVGYDDKPAMLDVRIVGLIRDERTASPGFPDPAVVYVPLAQSPARSLKLLVRTPEQTAAVMPAIRAAVAKTDPHLPLGNVATMTQVLDETLLPASRPAWLIGIFALVAALLAAIGLYGLMAHSVALQRREIGIRMALGAQPRDVLLHVLREALVMVAGGILVGLLGTFALTRVLRSLLFEVSPLDPLALSSACVILILIGLAAGVLPARRAARIDPAATLREAG